MTPTNKVKCTVGSILGLTFSMTTFGGEIDTSCPQHVAYSAPKSEAVSQELCRIGYAVGYSYHYKDPVYSVVHLTKESAQGTVKRKDSFKEDASIPTQYRATLNDYKNTPYDRGHMTSAGDLSWSYDTMIESFYLSNMVPQNPSVNRGPFRMLEITVRNWAIKHGSLYVYTGPVFMNNYSVIGKSAVAVPQDVYKVVYDPALNKAIAFIIPNLLNVDVKDMTEYVVSIDEVERLTGIDFFPTMPADKKSVKEQISKMEEW